MQTLSHLWRSRGAWRARHAYGLAPQGQAWVLVGLTRLAQDVVRVQTTSTLEALALSRDEADADQHARSVLSTRAHPVPLIGWRQWLSLIHI